MFKKNKAHLQLPLTSHIDELPEKLRERLEESWSGVFYRELFCRIDEGSFEVLYADCPSRPNIPVNVQVGLEILKAGNGWTDQQLYDAYCYNIQVRYALGYRQLGEGHFELRTRYNFRERLSRYMQETGINLLDQAFAQITDEQIEAYQIKTGRQRMDSTQIASNIRQMGRVQLLVTVIQRVVRMLSEQASVCSKPNNQLSASSMQSPDDLEATYRNKRGQGYRGYTANITETCDPENELQLITKVQTAPNNVDDTQLLDDALSDLDTRTELHTLYTDGGYGSPETDEALREKEVHQIQTAIRGRKPDAEKLHLSDFEIKQNESGKPTQVTCPWGHKVNVQTSSRRKSFAAYFEIDTCQACPHAQVCPASPGKRDPRRRLRFTQAQADVAQRRRHSQIHLQEGRNLRAAVEATVRQVKHPFPGSKLPVRGQFRASCMIIGSALMSNIRRIHGFRVNNSAKNDKSTEIERKGNPLDPFGSCFWDIFSFNNRAFVF